MMQVLVSEGLAKSCRSIGVRVSTIRLHDEELWEREGLDGEICVVHNLVERDRFCAGESVKCFKLSDILMVIIEDCGE